MADLDVREGRLKDVEVSGDFFLGHPRSPPTSPAPWRTRRPTSPRRTSLQRMSSTFAERNTESGLMEDRLSPEELAEAEELARTKYGTREWIYTLP
jgi:hypothetical protein